MASIISVGKYDDLGEMGVHSDDIKMDQEQILAQDGNLDWIEVAHGKME
jgi:hypothetical protein